MISICIYLTDFATYLRVFFVVIKSVLQICHLFEIRPVFTLLHTRCPTKNDSYGWRKVIESHLHTRVTREKNSYIYSKPEPRTAYIRLWQTFRHFLGPCQEWKFLRRLRYLLLVLFFVHSTRISVRSVNNNAILIIYDSGVSHTFRTCATSGLNFFGKKERDGVSSKRSILFPS